MAVSPGKGAYIAAAVLALAGLAVAAAVVFRFFQRLPEPERFLAPGSATVVVAAPGPHVIWHEHRTVFEGRAFDVPAALPDGARLRVTDPRGKEVEIAASGGMTVRSGTMERVSVARFEASEAGPHEVAVEGDVPPRVIVAGPDFLWPLLKTIALAMGAAVVGIGTGGALALYAFLQGTTAPPGPAGAAVTPEREASLRRLTALVYGLHAAALVVGVTSLAAVIVNYVKRDEVAGTWLETHFDWQIRTFWIALAWSLVGLATLVLLVGFVVLLATSVWFVYRIVKGWTALNDGREVGGSA